MITLREDKIVPEQIYRKWKKTLYKPDDSIFYYHPSLERIILGLAMYAIASRPYISKLGKAESLSLYNLYINEMVTEWIDETNGFEYLFTTLRLCQMPFHTLLRHLPPSIRD